MEKSITLFSSGCPKCKVLEKKLIQANIKFDIESDCSGLLDMGFQFAPVLKVEDKYYDYINAIAWLKDYKEH